jgi:hypothetical protein
LPDDFLEPPPQPPAEDGGEGGSSTHDEYVFNWKLQVF